MLAFYSKKRVSKSPSKEDILKIKIIVKGNL